MRSRRFLFAAVASFGLFLPVTGYLANAEELPAPAAPTVAAADKFRPYESTNADRARSVLGLAVLVGICFAFSRNRKAIDWRLVGIGLGLQAIFAVLVLGPLRPAFDAANTAIVRLLDYSQLGASFLFKSYITDKVESSLVNFAFAVLPSIVFFSSLMAVLYHLGIMQVVVRGIAWAMLKTMRTSGAETLSTAANIFVGQTEAPLLVRPFVSTFTKSELLVVMAGGMANTAGGVLAAYVSMLKMYFPDIGGHLLAQSIMSAPAALVMSKMLWPEDGVPTTQGMLKIDIPKVDANVVDAAARGASEGLQLALNVAAMLLAFIALVALLDGTLATITDLVIGQRIGFTMIAGWLFTPFAYVMGVPWDDCQQIGRLLGTKIVINEFVAYKDLAEGLTTGTMLISARAGLIASYALSGFANFSSIAIQIGGIGALAPERRGDIAALGLLAMVAGSFATFMTACFAGILL